MAKEILISGFLGGVVVFLVLAACRIFLPGVARTELQPMPGQELVHAVLKAQITKPGVYICPYLPPDRRSGPYPDYLNEPIFAVTYRGTTHATVPGFVSVGVLSFLLAPMVAAWLLSQASTKVMATYSRRVIFVVTLGLFVAFSSDLLRAMIDELPFSVVVGMMGVSMITWTLAGLILAWRIKPMPASSR